MPGVKNLYYTSYFPFLSILLFSAAFAVSVKNKLTAILEEIGIYQALGEFFTMGNISLMMFGGFVLFFFMLFSALKVVADMLMQFSCLFFADDKQEEHDRRMKEGRFIFIGGAVLSLLVSQSVVALSAVLTLTIIGYFIFTANRLSRNFTTASLIGFILFQLLFWLIFLLSIGYIILRTYRYILEHLPV